MKKKNRAIQLFGEVKDVEITRKIYFLIITLMEKLNLYLNSPPYSFSSSLYLQDILVFFHQKICRLKNVFLLYWSMNYSGISERKKLSFHIYCCEIQNLVHSMCSDKWPMDE